MSGEDRQAIDERKQLIEARARALAEEAVRTGEAWTPALGARPTAPAERDRWLAAVITVAAYRDRYRITSDLPSAGERRATRNAPTACVPAGRPRGREHRLSTGNGTSPCCRTSGSISSIDPYRDAVVHRFGPLTTKTSGRNVRRGGLSRTLKESTVLLVFLVPVLVLVTYAHRYLRRYAPSNVVIAAVKTPR